MSIVIKSQTIESPRYANVLMDNDITMGRIRFDWNPVALNRVLRFFRFFKYVERVVREESVKVQQSLKI